MRVASIQLARWGFLLSVALALLPGAVGAAAAPDLYTGTLYPKDHSTPIPFILELTSSAGRLSGKFKAARITPAEGLSISGRAGGAICSLRSERWLDQLIEFEGECISNRFLGKFWIQSKGKLRQEGTFTAAKVVPDKEEKKDETRKKDAKSTLNPSTSMAACLRSNGTCLATCSASDPDEQFLCANRCKRRLATCKAHTKTSRVPTPPPYEE